MKSHNAAVGPDEIHYEFLKQLPSCSLDFLLQAFNEVWVSGKFPTSWKQATIIPIPKPGKHNTDPSNYRPIALTSCLCKTLERMINTRLIWFLESNGLITNFQCGFRSKRSTADHLVCLETFVREAFIKKEHLTAVFFDLEKAYDTTWKYGIMRDLSDFGLKGRLPIFIDNFLSNRNFKVRVGTTLSGLQGQEEGVPQGSILSVTLFSIKINNIVNIVKNPGVDCSLYVDDFLICYRSKHIYTIERQLQQCLNKIQNWALENGFKFSKTHKEMFARKQSAIPSFGIRIQALLDISNIPNDNVHATVIPQVPPWTMHHPKVCLDISVLAEKDTPSHIYIKKFYEIKDQYSYCTPIYTDGSKDNDRVGRGLVINNLSIKQRLTSNASIFTAKATAIDLALDTITESDDDHFIIFSDSLSVLLSLHNRKIDNPLILQLLQKLHHLSCANKTIHLCWIPSHIGIR